MIDDCRYPKWESKNRLKDLGKHLNKKMKKYKKIIKAANDLRRKATTDNNYLLIEQFYQARLKMIRELNEEYERIMRKFEEDSDDLKQEL